MTEQQLGEATPQPSGEEGRVHARHDCELPGSCRPVSSWTRPDASWGGTITNISLGGVRLRLPRRFEPGSGVAIELPDAGGAGTCVVFAKVVHARAASDGSWELGCKFISELGEEEFHRLLYAPPHLASFSPHEPPAGESPPVAPSHLDPEPAPSPAGTPDQRCHDRHQPLESNVLRLAIRPAFGGRPALLVDVSAGGVGLLLDRPLEEGDVLAVELGGPEGGGPRLAQVRHCRPCPVPADAPWLPRIPPLARFCRRLLGLAPPNPEGRAWVIGCRFTRPFAEEEVAGLLEMCRGRRDVE